MLPANILQYIAAVEDEELEEQRNANLEQRQMRDASDPFSIGETHFIDLFRLTKDMARYVLNSIIPHLQNRDGAVDVPVPLKFFSTLTFYATGSYQRLIGQSYNISMSQQSTCRAIHEVTIAIVNNLSEEWIQFPRTAASKNRIKVNFMTDLQFPGTIGCIDGTHIAIIKPVEEEHNYLNRKGYHSKNIQVDCDSNLKILNVKARFAGATHDSFIWRHSAVRNELQRCFNEGDRTSWLLGDSGYPQEPWLMTPVDNAIPGTPEFRYTQAHIHARNCVERCFGVLKGRFRCLLSERKLRYSPEKVANIIHACCILHNICSEAIMNGDVEIPPAENHIPFPYQHQNNEGFMARQRLINQYFR